MSIVCLYDTKLHRHKKHGVKANIKESVNTWSTFYSKHARIVRCSIPLHECKANSFARGWQMYLMMAHINVRSFLFYFFILLSALCAIVFLYAYIN